MDALHSTTPALRPAHWTTDARRLRLARAFDAVVVDEFRANGGRVGGSYPFSGRPVLLLHHREARTGVVRVTPLACAAVDDGWLVAGTRGGRSAPAWCDDLRVHPRVTVETGAGPGTATVAGTARELHGVERDAGWERLALVPPGRGDHPALTGRVIPVFHLAAAP
jgi:deazaflavin-dependent oxidoreductase (nitroreductase family)